MASLPQAPDDCTPILSLRLLGQRLHCTPARSLACHNTAQVQHLPPALIYVYSIPPFTPRHIWAPARPCPCITNPGSLWASGAYPPLWRCMSVQSLAEVAALLLTGCGPLCCCNILAKGRVVESSGQVRWCDSLPTTSRRPSHVLKLKGTSVPQAALYSARDQPVHSLWRGEIANDALQHRTARRRPRWRTARRPCPGFLARRGPPIGPISSPPRLCLHPVPANQWQAPNHSAPDSEGRSRPSAPAATSVDVAGASGRVRAAVGVARGPAMAHLLQERLLSHSQASCRSTGERGWDCKRAPRPLLSAQRRASPDRPPLPPRPSSHAAAHPSDCIGTDASAIGLAGGAASGAPTGRPSRSQPPRSSVRLPALPRRSSPMPPIA